MRLKISEAVAAVKAAAEELQDLQGFEIEAISKIHRITGCTKVQSFIGKGKKNEFTLPTPHFLCTLTKASLSASYSESVNFTVFATGVTKELWNDLNAIYTGVTVNSFTGTGANMAKKEWQALLTEIQEAATNPDYTENIWGEKVAVFHTNPDNNSRTARYFFRNGFDTIHKTDGSTYKAAEGQTLQELFDNIKDNDVLQTGDPTDYSLDG